MKAPVPAKLPHLHTILDNLGLPDKQVARFLDVSPSTVKRWRIAGQAPRPVMLALFWETDWGRSAVACDAVNWGRMLTAILGCKLIPGLYQGVSTFNGPISLALQ